MFTGENLEMGDTMDKEDTNGRMDPTTRVSLEMGNVLELGFGDLKKMVGTFITGSLG